MPLNTKQIAVIVGGLIILVLLYFAPKKITVSERGKETEAGHEHEHEHEHAEDRQALLQLVDSVKKMLKPEEMQIMKGLEEQNLLDSLSMSWARLNQPVMAAYYADQSASKEPSKEKLMKAGNRSYMATRFAAENIRHLLFDMAKKNYEQVLEKDSSDLLAKTNLGACYVEGSSDPMKGITLLREVVAKDSTFIDAHLRLAMFAVQSGQFDKAIERYEKILKIDPKFIEAYLYLGEVYASMNEKEKAIKSLEKFKELSNDAVVASEVDKYINELKNK